MSPNASTQATRRQRRRELDRKVARRDADAAACGSGRAAARRREPGTLSYQRIGVSQLMQADPGCTIGAAQRHARRDYAEEAAESQPGHEDEREDEDHLVVIDTSAASLERPDATSLLPLR